MSPEQKTIDAFQLSGWIIKKHEKLLEEYREEFGLLSKDYGNYQEVGKEENKVMAIRERIEILNDKESQLQHWVELSEANGNVNSGGDIKGYKDEIKCTHKELEKLRGELEKLRKMHGLENIKEEDAKGRCRWLSLRIESHEKALDYWKKRKLDFEEGKIESGKRRK